MIWQFRSQSVFCFYISAVENDNNDTNNNSSNHNNNVSASNSSHDNNEENVIKTENGKFVKQDLLCTCFY